MNAKEIVIQAAFRRDQIRNDGWPRSGMSPSDVAVILGFETKAGPMAFPCDRFNSWEDNMRAIALSLQALRAVDRYGVTRKAEQYTGWKQLPPPSDQPFSNKMDAASFIAAQVTANATEQGRLVYEILGSPEKLQAAYRAAAQRMHPDSANGSHELFVTLRAAMKMLEA